MTNIAIDLIRTDGGTQPRAAIDFEVVDDYSDQMASGTKFPPVDVFYDGTVYWLADGFHRLKGAGQAGFTEILVTIHQGTQQDAQWFSFGANRTNGLRRSNDDKQRAVKAALLHPGGAGKSDRDIAKHVGVDHKTVLAWREKLTGEFPQSTMRTGSDVRTINTANIGRRKTVPAEEPAPTAEQYIADDAEREPLDLNVALPPIPPHEPILTAPPVREAQRPRPVPIVPPKPAQAPVDKEAAATHLLRAVFDLAEHQITAAEVVALVPDEHIATLNAKALAAFEFVGFVFENARKRAKGQAA